MFTTSPTTLPSGTATTTSPHNANNPAHHWRIEEANGEVGTGVCKICGAVRQFKNWLPETDYTTRSEHEFAA